MSLTAPKRTQKFGGGCLLSVGVVAAVAVLQGGMIVLDGGYARPARAGQGGTDLLKMADVADYRVVGMALQSVTGGAGDGDVTLDVEYGTYLLGNSGGVDVIAVSDVGKLCYAVDDETVALTSASGTRPIAGVIREVGSSGVWVEISPVASALAQRSVFLPFAISETDTLAGTPAELVSPVAGNVARMTAIVQKAVTTGGPLTAAVGVTAVAGLSCVIADGAAKGTVVTDTPTAGDASTAVVPGSRIQIVPDAAFATAGAISGVLEIAY